MITPDTTLRELAEVLRAHRPLRVLTLSAPLRSEAWEVLSRDGWASGPDLAAAISAALEKAGAR